jgi:hypothetical protein
MQAALAPDGGEWLVSRRRKEPGTPWTAGWMGPCDLLKYQRLCQDFMLYGVSCQFVAKRRMNHNIRLFSFLLKDNFALLNAEKHDKTYKESNKLIT